MRRSDRRLLTLNDAWRKLLRERGLTTGVRTLEECFGSWTRPRVRERLDLLTVQEEVAIRNLPLLGSLGNESTFYLHARRLKDRTALIALVPSPVRRSHEPAAHDEILGAAVAALAPRALALDADGVLLAAGPEASSDLKIAPQDLARPLACQLRPESLSALEAARHRMMQPAGTPPAPLPLELRFSSTTDALPFTLRRVTLGGQPILLLEPQKAAPDRQAGDDEPREEWFELLTEQAPVGFFTTDEEGVITWCNGLFRALLAVGERRPPLNLPARVSSPQKDDFTRLYERAIEKRQAFSLEARFGPEPGRILMLRASPRGEGAAFDGYFGTLSDVTRARESVERLEREKTLLQAVLQAMNDGVIACDAHFGVRLTNPAARQLLGLPTGGGLAAWVSSRLARPPGALPWECGPDSPGEGVLELVSEGGARTVHWQRTELPSNREAFRYLVSLRDVTKEHATLGALERSNDELRSFARSISHDLKSPMRAISGLSEALLEDHDASLPEDARRCLEHIRAAAQQLRRNVDDLLGHAQIGAEGLVTVKVPLARVFRAVLDSLTPRILESEATVIEPASYPSVWGQETLLTRVFHNLVDNALKFVEEGQAPWVRIGARVEGSEAVLEVEDHGLGISEAHQERIWAPFGRLHAQTRFEGSGIGLAVVHKTVALLGGRVDLHSRPGKGSLFEVRLPTHGQTTRIAGDAGLDGEAAAVPPPSKEDARTPHGGAREGAAS